VRRRERGYTLMEVVWVLAIFGVFLFIFTTMQEELRRQERKYPIDFMQHPQITAVMSRLRRDVIDAFAADPYPPTFQDYVQSGDTLIVYTILGAGAGYTVVWDFRTDGEARRTAYSGGMVISDWKARAVPRFMISTYEIPNRPFAVRVRARTKEGTLAIDQIFQPRAHE
jgi:prepilin-type N-terminal cleavage/methylation domain-containing protein